MSEVIVRMAYRHISGETFVVAAVASSLKEGEDSIVVLSSLKDASVKYCYLSKFFDKHPKTQIPRFELVTPK